MLVTLETSGKYLTREHLSPNEVSRIFKPQQNSEYCAISCSIACFEILDSAATNFHVKLKDAMYFNWKTNFNSTILSN